MEIKKADYIANNKFMQMAIEEARLGMYNKHGGPFGAVIVKDGEVVGKGHNMVLLNNDSTAHGEISAIRDAEKNLKNFSLKGCELYTTGEPCYMCLNACIWADIEKVYYGCTITDNAIAGFKDEKYEVYFNGRDKLQGNYLEELDREACIKLFEEFSQFKDIRY